MRRTYALAGIAAALLALLGGAPGPYRDIVLLNAAAALVVAGRSGDLRAGAAVAAVSRTLLDAGARVCLFTDQANPTSNALYQRLGFEPVVDMANLAVRGAWDGSLD